jgi:hypothetical protein
LTHERVPRHCRKCRVAHHSKFGGQLPRPAEGFLRAVCVRPDPPRSTRWTETCTPYRHTKCGRFVILKHNLLSQHDIADWDILLR